MTNPCSLRKITLGKTGFASLVLRDAPSGQLVCERKPTEYPNAGERNAVGSVPDKGNLNYYSPYSWKPNALINEDERSLLGEYLAAYKQIGGSSGIIFLQDENELLSTTEATFHPRTLVPDSIVTRSGGRTEAFYVFNTYIRIDSSPFLIPQGGNIWLLNGLSFIEVV